MDGTDNPRGIYPMLYAFFTRAGGLDREGMRRQVEACVRNGAHGLAVLGLGTEVNKLTGAERRQLVAWVAEDLRGRLPLVVTVNAPTVDAQVAVARHARSLGAAWVILQPPPERNAGDEYLVRFFGAVADRVDLPVAIQNAPEYLGVGLTPDGVDTLARNHANFRILKGEGSALAVRRFVERLPGRVAVFNGRGGLELLDNLRAGCAGIIPATESVDLQVRIFDLLRAGDGAQAEVLYRELLPAVVFVMQSLDTLHAYGKRIAALRLGLGEVFDRAPGLAPDEFGLLCTRRYADALGPLA